MENISIKLYYLINLLCFYFNKIIFMGNPLTNSVTTGTIGELLVQLKLLEFGIQASFPLKDSGNDLIGIKGRAIKLIQIKTTKSDIRSLKNLPAIYDFIFLVYLKELEDSTIDYNNSKIYIIEGDKPLNSKVLMTRNVVNRLWSRANDIN